MPLTCSSCPSRKLRQSAREPGTVTTHHQKSPQPLPPPRSHSDASLLYIRVGVSIREDIRVLLAEDMAHAAAGNDLQAAPAHPYSEGDFCKTATPSSHCSAFPRRGHRLAALRHGRQKCQVGRAGCTQPGPRGLGADSTARLHAPWLGSPGSPALHGEGNSLHLKDGLCY